MCVSVQKCVRVCVPVCVHAEASGNGAAVDDSELALPAKKEKKKKSTRDADSLFAALAEDAPVDGECTHTRTHAGARAHGHEMPDESQCMACSIP